MPELPGGDAEGPRPSSGALVSQLMLGYMTSQLMRAALRLELADRIGTGARTSRELAEETGAHAPSLTRLLRALASLGLAQEVEPYRFALTPAGRRLRADVPDSLHAMATVFTDESMHRAWEDLPESLRSGAPAFPAKFGTDYYTHLSNNPELSHLFNEAHGQTTRGVAARLVRAYDFASAQTIVDVGGGDGTLLAAILAAAPATRGIVYDTAAGLAAAPATLADAGVTDRCEVRVGDFLAEVPAGADLYLIKSTLHNWDDEHSATVLDNCRKAVPAHGKLLLVETVLPAMVDPTDSPFAYLSDLNMLVNLGGRERTEPELRTLLTGCGFRVTAVRTMDRSTDLGLRLIEAQPL